MGAVNVPSARRKFVVPPPEDGTAPERPDVKALIRAVNAAWEPIDGMPEPSVSSAPLLAVTKLPSLPALLNNNPFDVPPVMGVVPIVKGMVVGADPQSVSPPPTAPKQARFQTITGSGETVRKPCAAPLTMN